VEVRKVIRLRGSYMVYLPKRVASSFASDEVSVFWEGDFVGVRPLALRRAAADLGLAAAVVAGYAAGLDELELPASEEARKAAEKIGARLEESGGRLLVRYADRYPDKEEAVERMLDVLLFLLQGLARGTARHATVEAADDETDVLRLSVNRLCAKAPVPKCAFYIQLARYYERAVDHVRELHAERPPREVWAILREAAEGLRQIHRSPQIAAIAQYLSATPSLRFSVMQHTRGELQTVHAMRTVDYLENAAEVYLDMAVYAAQTLAPAAQSPRASRRRKTQQ
jgi:phosphate uptake regulator